MLLEIVLALFTLYVSRVLWMRWKYDMHRIPSLRGLPLLGHALSVRTLQGEQELSCFLGTYSKKLGSPKVMKVNLAGAVSLIVTDLDCVKNVICHRTKAFPKSPLVIDYLVGMAGNDRSAKALMLTLGVTPYTKAIRKVYAIGFQSSNMKRSIPKLRVVMGKVTDIIDAEMAKGPINFQKLFVRMTLDVIGVLVFDTNLGGLDGSRDLYESIIEAGHATIDSVLSPLKKMYKTMFPNSEPAVKHRNLLAKVNGHWDRLIKEFTARDDPPEGEEPMWHALRSLIDPDTGKKITYKSLMGEVAAVAVAGMDTTGHQLAWIFALLAANPRVVDKVLEELKGRNLYGEGSREIEFDDLGELPYITAVCKEGMRVANILPAGIFHRVPPQDCNIGGYRVPKGTLISVPGNRWMGSEEEWGDPEVFRPERWLTDEDMSKKYFLGFSYGPRDCIGQKLAWMEMRLVISKLISKYTFTGVMSFDELMKTSRSGITIEAVNGICLNVAPRESSATA